jgi:hypothetical protein
VSGIDPWDILLAGVVGDVVVQRASRTGRAHTEDDVVRRGLAAAQVAQHLGHATPEQLQLMAEAKLVMDRRALEAAQRARSDATFTAGAGVLLLLAGLWAAVTTDAAGWLVVAGVGGLLLPAAFDRG